jgi:hypothetical protein
MRNSGDPREPCRPEDSHNSYSRNKRGPIEQSRTNWPKSGNTDLDFKLVCGNVENEGEGD